MLSPTHERFKPVTYINHKAQDLKTQQMQSKRWFICYRGHVQKVEDAYTDDIYAPNMIRLIHKEYVYIFVHLHTISDALKTDNLDNKSAHVLVAFCFIVIMICMCKYIV